MIQQKESHTWELKVSPFHATESHSSPALSDHQKIEIAKYKQIAVDKSSPAKGGFLYAFLLAFKRADNENALILLPAMQEICRKYDLSEGPS